MTRPKRLDIAVTGTSFHEAMDPKAVEFPRENPDLPEPIYKKCGGGFRMIYRQCSPEVAIAIRDQLNHYAWVNSSDCYGRGHPIEDVQRFGKVRQALLVDSRRITSQLAGANLIDGYGRALI